MLIFGFDFTQRERETHAQIQKEEKKERRQNNGVFFWFNSIKM